MAAAIAGVAVALTAGCSSPAGTPQGGPAAPPATTAPPATSAAAGPGAPSQSPSRTAPATTTPSATVWPASSPTPATAPPGAAGGPCTAGQLVLASQQAGSPFSSGGTTTASVIQYFRNTGATCTLRMPVAIEVAGASGSFVTAEVSGVAGVASRVIAHGQAQAFALGSWWPSNGQALVPSNSPSWCKTPVTNVTSVQIPLAAGSLQFHLNTTFQAVCKTPGTLNLTLYAG